MEFRKMVTTTLYAKLSLIIAFLYHLAFETTFLS